MPRRSSKPSTIGQRPRHPSLQSISFDERRGSFTDAVSNIHLSIETPFLTMLVQAVPSKSTSVSPSDVLSDDDYPLPLSTLLDEDFQNEVPSASTCKQLKPKKKSHAKQKPPGYIPRPKNAFMQYRSDMVREKKVTVRPYSSSTSRCPYPSSVS